METRLFHVITGGISDIHELLRKGITEPGVQQRDQSKCMIPGQRTLQLQQQRPNCNAASQQLSLLTTSASNYLYRVKFGLKSQTHIKSVRPGGRGRDRSSYSKQRGTSMFSSKTVTFLTQEALSHMQLSSPLHLLRNYFSCGHFSSQRFLRLEKVSLTSSDHCFPQNCCYVSEIKAVLCQIFLYVHSPMELSRFLLDSAPRIAQKTASPQSNKCWQCIADVVQLPQTYISVP